MGNTRSSRLMSCISDIEITLTMQEMKLSISVAGSNVKNVDYKLNDSKNYFIFHLLYSFQPVIILF